MVVRLEGKVQGQDIIFKHVKGDDWEAVIPKNLTGIYIIELTAYDDNGNTAFTTRYILTVDLDALCIHLEPYPFWADILPDTFCANILPGNYYARLCHGGDSINSLKIVMDLGETRHVQLKICSSVKDDFNILDATYVLQKMGDQEAEDSGRCVIREHIIDTVITPKEPGTYKFQVTYTIADEVLIDTVEVRVME